MTTRKPKKSAQKKSEKKSPPKQKTAAAVTDHAGLLQLRQRLGEALPELSWAGMVAPKHLAHMVGMNAETVRSLVHGRLDFHRDTPVTRAFAENLSLATGVHHDIRNHIDAGKPILDVWGKPYDAQTYLRWREILSAQRFGELLGENDRRPTYCDPLNDQAHTLVKTIFRILHREHDFRRELMACQLMKKALVEVAENLGILESLQHEGMRFLRGNMPSLQDVEMGVGDLSEDHPAIRIVSTRWNPEDPWVRVRAPLRDDWTSPQ